MPDLTAKRTLVKSPPELWEELSEVERLAKHLGAFGEITITKLEPEHTVAWEGERASGTVSIEPSGWGTKVTLRAELPEPEPEPEAEPEPAPQPEPEPGPAAEAEPAPEPAAEPEPAAQAPEPEPEPVTLAETSEEAPRRGFWGWLFRSRTGAPASEATPNAAEPEPEPVAEPELVAAEPMPEAAPEEPVAEAPAAQTVEIDAVAVQRDNAEEPAPEAEPEAEPEPEPALDPERARVILDEALDTLGSAHHRPFSRG